jgi:uncharacterized DUF497 family protein
MTKSVSGRGLSFEWVADLDWETALIWEDVRRDYGERRMRVLAWLKTRLHAVVITYRDEAAHVIRFGRANQNGNCPGCHPHATGQQKKSKKI